MMKNSKQQELASYKKYQMSIKEYVLYGITGLGIVSVFAYFFYKSYYAILLMSPFVIFYIRYKSIELGEKRRKSLMIQFKEAINSVNGSVQAGYSLENAFCESYQEMKEFYGEDSDIVRELYNIKKGLSNNVQITGLLSDFADRSGIGDIDDFVSVLVISKHSGGNIVRIMESYINIVDEKVAIMQEIDTLISAKRFEQKIMNIVPFFIIFYVNITSPGFFNMLYGNIAGVAIMTVALILYVASVLISNRITKIRI